MRSLSVSVALAEPPLRQLAQPLSYLSDVLADPALSGDLARLSMRRALRLMARHPDLDELLDRLEGAGDAPWPQLRAALAETAHAGHGSTNADPA